MSKLYINRNRKRCNYCEGVMLLSDVAKPDCFYNTTIPKDYAICDHILGPIINDTP
eukprot:UN16204